VKVGLRKQGMLFPCHERKIFVRGRCNVCIKVFIKVELQGTR
jgi:hypothetical protein